ncbi:hypothetical protein G7046_g3513 [Stylonectria norvegica]|nr:hypothetical protein G7046_g3513 [Stylonectria norvegica]
MATPEKFFDLNCPSGGDFYICQNNSTEFVGCCASDPCSDNAGTCPETDLRTTSFNGSTYSILPTQDCDDARGTEIWYTCAFTNPPFIGCCDENPCGNTGCARSKVVPAMLSNVAKNRDMFLEPDGTRASSVSTFSSTATSSATSTESSTESSTATETTATSTASSAAAVGGKEKGLGTGAMVGIAVGATAIGLLLFAWLLWKFCWLPRKRKQEGTQNFHEVAPGLYQPNTPGTTYKGTFSSHQSPMSHYQQSFASTPTAVGGLSPEMHQNYSPHAQKFDQNTLGNFSNATSTPGLDRQMSGMQINSPQEMDASTTVAQELGTGEEHQRYQGQDHYQLGIRQ